MIIVIEAKMDHVSVISIKKGSIWAQLADFADSPFKQQNWTKLTSTVQFALSTIEFQLHSYFRYQ